MRCRAHHFVLLLLSFAFANADEHLELSIDGGESWLPSEPNSVTAAIPATVLFRLRGSNSFISLPACAVNKGAAIVEWRGLTLMGVNATALCTEQGLEHTYTDPEQLVPAWHKYLRTPKSDSTVGGRDGTGKNGKKKKEKKRGWWSKYGWVIGLFVAYSLIQGIREGNAEYEKEQAEERRAKAAAESGASTAKTTIVVPRKKGKGKKNAKKNN